MGYIKSVGIRGVLRLFALTIIAGFAGASIPVARAGNGWGVADLPSPLCDGLQLPSDSRVAFRLFAVGVQVYRWNGTAWTFVEPVATLYADEEYRIKAGTHYAGPTWEGIDGSKVVGARLADCSPDTASIPWLLLHQVSTEGPGIFAQVTYIQRVNTKGGLAPIAPGASIGVTAQIPYTTEYVFARPKR